MSRARGHIRLTAIVLALAILLVILIANSPVSWKLPPRSDFPLVGGNWANQRYSTLDKINGSNVKKLRGAWRLHLEGGEPAGLAGNMEATPIVIDGTMFISSGPGNVFAIDATTGTVKWKYRSEANVGPLTNRGVVVAEGKVFSGQRDNTLIALDQRTGALLWKTPLANPGRGHTVAPAVYCNGRVYIGVAGGE